MLHLERFVSFIILDFPYTFTNGNPTLSNTSFYPNDLEIPSLDLANVKVQEDTFCAIELIDVSECL